MNDTALNIHVSNCGPFTLVKQHPHVEDEVIITVVSEQTGVKYSQVFPTVNQKELRPRITEWLKKITEYREAAHISQQRKRTEQ